jgi:hypothetical protein
MLIVRVKQANNHPLKILGTWYLPHYVIKDQDGYKAIFKNNKLLQQSVLAIS